MPRDFSWTPRKLDTLRITDLDAILCEGQASGVGQLSNRAPRNGCRRQCPRRRSGGFVPGYAPLAKDNPRYGYRRLHALLPREGYAVNHKRVQRLCREEGPRVRVSRRKRARVGTSTTPGDRLRAQFPNHVWALDFAFDQTADARVLIILIVTDEFTKTALAIKVERSITGDHLVRILDRLVAVHGHPRFIRMDNGPQMTCNAISDWCRFSSTGSVFIEPGSPSQDAFVESFNSKLRDELLAIEVFHSLPKPQS